MFPPAAPFANTGGEWKDDWEIKEDGSIGPMEWHTVIVTPDTKNGKGRAIIDHHQGKLTYSIHQATGRKYIWLAGTTQDYRIMFKRTDNNESAGPDFEWGFVWRSDSYTWTNNDQPPAPVPLCVSPSQNGAGPHVISGYGEGTDNFTGLTYVEDINEN